MKKSLKQQYGENYVNIQWDMENDDMANEVEDLYVPPLPNQSNLEYNTSFKYVEVRAETPANEAQIKLENQLQNDYPVSKSKAYFKPKEITITLDKSTADIVEVSSNEEEIISHFQKVLEIQSKKKNKKKRRSRDHLI